MRASVICKIIIKKLLYLTLKEIKILFVETLKCDCSEYKEPHTYLPILVGMPSSIYIILSFY